VGQFTSNPLIRNIIGQPKSSFDIRELMDQKKILIINLSKGRVGEVNATLLGSMLVTKIYLAAMSRADVSAQTMKNLPSFYFYVDEFQNFANESFSDILSEARKYKLRLIIAHQYVEQMEEEVRDAVFGNVGSTIAFRVGPFDAETLEAIFAPQFEATDLVNLGFAQIYLTLMIDGVGSPPFSATTLPPFDPSPDDVTGQVLKSSREQFGKPRDIVETSIKKWQDDSVPNQEQPKPRYGATGAAKPREIGEAAISWGKPAAPRAVSTTAPIAPRPVVTAPVAVVVPVPVAPAPTVVQAVKVETPAPQVQVHIHTPKAPASRPATPRHAPAAPKVARQESPKPPLEGATSLRDALAAVTAKKPEVEAPVEKAEHKPHHHHELKNTLHDVAPEAESKNNPQPASLSKEVLHDMLRVDEEHTEG
jgi:hypothetical protein